MFVNFINALVPHAYASRAAENESKNKPSAVGKRVVKENYENDQAELEDQVVKVCDRNMQTWGDNIYIYIYLNETGIPRE